MQKSSEIQSKSGGGILLVDLNEKLSGFLMLLHPYM
jgi:hypothetical protein